MPGPEPGTVWIEEWDGCTFATFVPYSQWPPFGPKPQNRHRRNRALRIGIRISHGTWVCSWCHEELHFDKRADAQYCGERCRKQAARWRRIEGVNV